MTPGDITLLMVGSLVLAAILTGVLCWKLGYKDGYNDGKDYERGRAYLRQLRTNRVRAAPSPPPGPRPPWHQPRYPLPPPRPAARRHAISAPRASMINPQPARDSGNGTERLRTLTDTGELQIRADAYIARIGAEGDAWRAKAFQ